MQRIKYYFTHSLKQRYNSLNEFSFTYKVLNIYTYKVLNIYTYKNLMTIKMKNKIIVDNYYKEIILNIDIKDAKF